MLVTDVGGLAGVPGRSYVVKPDVDDIARCPDGFSKNNRGKSLQKGSKEKKNIQSK